MAISFQQENLTMEELLNDGNLNVTNIKTGDIITGKVVAYQPEENPEALIIGMSSKSEGKIFMREFDEKPHIGQEIEALVQSIDRDSGLILLSKKRLEQQRGWDIIVEASEKDIPMSAIVKRSLKQGFLVNVEAVPMFLPMSLVGNLITRGGRKDNFTNSTITVKIIELNSRRKTGVVSRKAFQNEQNEQQWKALLENVKIGDIVAGKVIKHTKVGALVEVSGVQGFLHKSNISWERNQSNFEAKLPVDSAIDVRILEIDPENHRLSLGLKQLTEDPWENVMQKISIGDILKGKVSFAAKYGAFIDIGSGLEGLLHISEMSWTRKVNHAQEIVKLDQEIETKVLGINATDKRISLGLRQLSKNPWDNIKTDYRIGQNIKATVKDITNFGIFISVTDDIDALIRKEDLSWDEPAPDPRQAFKKGDELECKIIELNFESRKIGCSLRHLLPNPYKELKRQYPKGTIIEGTITGIVDFGLFVKFADKYEGLVHLSAMTKEQSANHQKLFNKGDTLKVVIRSIDPETRKISLSLRDVDYALERIEIAQYIDKEAKDAPVTNNPFSSLRTVFPDSK